MRFGDYSQQVLQSTGSFTGYRPAQQLGHGYLSATGHFKQPLCSNEEGWGPLSPFRYDFTPCFIDVWVSSVAVFGLVCGPFALWYLLRKTKAADIPKDWHFWTKQVSFIPWHPFWQL
jgi:ATP-binding cassette subfamily C (CFTR/MRP) protein 1